MSKRERQKFHKQMNYQTLFPEINNILTGAQQQQSNIVGKHFSFNGLLRNNE